MLTIKYTTRFRKDYKVIKKRGYNIKLFTEVVGILASEQPLEQKYKDHALSGDYEGLRECHIQPDWLLIYRIEKDVLTLTLSRTGSHSDLF